MTNTSNNEEKQNLYTVLMEEMKAIARKLKEYGMSEKEIASILHTKQPLLKLTISRNYRLFLGDNHVEIQMEPLVKAVYLLFLKHPEGILFKGLPDYREELTEIYLQLRPIGLTERTKKSIEDVTDPTKNSINEKCARIRAVFINHLDEHLARHYYIDGIRAKPKKIALPRELIFWEE